jgi:hypothetical protein
MRDFALGSQKFLAQVCENVYGYNVRLSNGQNFRKCRLLEVMEVETLMTEENYFEPNYFLRKALREEF